MTITRPEYTKAKFKQADSAKTSENWFKICGINRRFRIVLFCFVILGKAEELDSEFSVMQFVSRGRWTRYFAAIISENETSWLRNVWLTEFNVTNTLERIFYNDTQTPSYFSQILSHVK